MHGVVYLLGAIGHGRDEGRDLAQFGTVRLESLVCSHPSVCDCLAQPRNVPISRMNSFTAFLTLSAGKSNSAATRFACSARAMLRLVLV
jgi:hypothetical protein